MEKEQAIKVIEQALDIAITKGVYNLNDAKTILIALEVIGKEEVKQETTKK
jgi:hypothetical protein